MKHSIKISLMAFVAMFAFSTTSNAQFGLKNLLGGSKSSYKKQQKAAEEAQKRLDAQRAAEMEELMKQCGTKPYDANAELPKSPIARTIYTDPNTGEKMMADLKSTYGDKTVNGFWSVSALEKEGYLDWQLKPEALDKEMVEKLFDKKFGGITSAVNATNARIDSKYGHKFKVGNIGTETPSWKYRRDDWGNMICRYVVLMVVMEFDDGENMIGRFEANQDHISGEAFDVDGTTVGYVNGNVNNTNQRVVNGWEVKTDCYTSTLANK